MKEKNSSVPVYQPSCSYYFSSGFVVSETAYSSAGCISHGPLYNAASRVIIDGGRKAAAYIAMAGMIVQNLDIAAYAGGIYHSVTRYDSMAVFSGLNTDGTSWTISGNSAFGFVIQNGWLNAKGGYVWSPVLNSNGHLIIGSGGQASGAEVRAGGEISVKSDGIISNTVLYAGGTANIYAGGSAAGITQSGGGNVNAIVQGVPGISAQYISGTNQEGSSFTLGYDNGTASAINFIINSGGWQYVSSGGKTINAYINSGGIINIYSGGQADGTIVSGGTLTLYSGGTAEYASVESGGTVNISGGTANSTTIYESGIQIVSSGGLALNTVIHPYGSQEVLSGGIASSTVVLSGGWQIVSSGGSAIDYAIETGGSQILKDGAYASGASVYGDLYVSNGAVSEDALIESGTQHVLYGGTALRAVIKGTGQQIVSAGGSASGTNIYSSGSQSVLAGGTADYATINESGTQNVYGAVYSAQINNLGVQSVASGGSADFTQINNGGQQILESAGMAAQTIINEGGLQSVGFRGTAINTTVDSGGSQIVYNEGQAASTYINSGGLQIINTGGKATSSYVSGGGLQEISGGTEISGTLSGGKITTATLYAEQKIYDGGLAKNIAISKLAKQEIYSGGTAESATVYASGSQTVLSGGIANSSIINSGGQQIVSSGGTAYNADVRFGGTQNVNIGGMADSTIINGSGSFWAHQYVGGTANDTVVNQLATQTVSGNAFRTAVNSGGSQLINVSGTAMSTTVNSGGSQNVYGSAYITEIKGSGIQNIYSGGTANFTIVSSGGSQVIEAGGSAINTILFDSTDQAYATGATVYGNLIVISSGLEIDNSLIMPNGNACYEAIISSEGYLTVESGAAAVYTTINDGGLSLERGGYALHTTINSGGQLETSGNNTLYGNTVLNSGGIIRANKFESSWSSGVLTVENLIADGGTFYMNVDLVVRKGDKIQITESHSGSALISLYNLVATAGQVSGTELKLVDYADGAEIAPDASFALADGTYEQGDYVYILEQGSGDNPDDKDYYLRSTGQNSNGANNAGSVPNFTGAGIGAALNSLQKRLGDLRGMGSTSERHGIWGRSYYKNMTVKAHENVKMDVSGLEAGYDFKLSGYDYSGDNYRNNGMYLGLMAASINISADGKGDGEGILGGGYATYLAENGWFADFTLRGGNAEMDLITHTNIGTRIQISPERSFIAASIEAGKTLDLRHNGKGWKIEPKAEMQYMKMDSKDTETNTHIPIHYGGVEYYTGIGAVYASYTSMRQNGMMTEPFAEITYRYEFDGEEKVKYQTANLKSDTGGGTVEGRIGVNMQLSSNLYWHAAASYEDGHSVKSYGADAGIRYTFGGK